MASHVFWRDVAGQVGVPKPGSWYVSPMARTLRTAEITWGALNMTEGGFRPVVKEVSFFSVLLGFMWSLRVR